MNLRISLFWAASIAVLSLPYAVGDELANPSLTLDEMQSELVKQAPDEDADSAISLAIRSKSVEPLAKLLDEGLDPNYEYKNLPLIFFLLSDECKDKHLSLLLKAGADANIQDSTFGMYPILWSVIHDTDICFQLLLEHGADPTVSDFKGRNAYIYALDLRSKTMLKQLWDHKVDLFQKNSMGFDPVHESVVLNAPEFFRELLLEHYNAKLKQNANEHSPRTTD